MSGIRPVPYWRLCICVFARAARFLPQLGLLASVAALGLLPLSALAQAGGNRNADTRQSLVDKIKGEDSRADLSADTVAGVRVFLDDKAKPERERLEVKIAFEQAKLKRRSFADRDALLTAHGDHAAELIRDFPAQPEGYGYLLSLAKAEKPAKARRAAASLLDSPAHDAIKQGAHRLLAHLDLEGTTLELKGAEAALDAARGRPLFIYAWTAGNAGILAEVRRLAKTTDFGFIGVNLDPDAAAARAAATGLPGTQLYDGGGLDGPLARQLQFTMTVALYLVDAQGVIREVDAHMDPDAALTRLVGGKRK